MRSVRKSLFYSLSVIFLVNLPSQLCAQIKPEQDTTMARQYFERGKKYGINALYDSSDYLLNLAGNIYRKNGDSVMYFASENEIISNLIYRSDYDAAAKKTDAILAVIRKHQGKEYQELTVDYYLNAAGISFRKGNYEKALKYTDTSLHLVEKHLPKDHVKKGVNYNIKAIMNRRMGNMETSMMLFDSALGNFIINNDDQGIAFVKTNMGNVLEAQGYIRQAEKYYKESVQLLIKLYGEEHPNVATCYDNLSNIYLQLQDFEQATFYAQQTIYIVRKIFGESHELEAHSYLNLGSIFERKEMPNQAISAIKKAEVIYKKIDEQHHYLTNVYQGLGDLYLKKNNVDSAFHFFSKHKAHIDRLFRSGISFQHAMSLSNFGDLALKKNENDKAFTFYQSSQVILEQSKLTKHPQFSENFIKIALIKSTQQQHRLAISYLNRAINACVDSAIFISENGLPTFQNVYSEINLLKAIHQKALLLTQNGDNNYNLASQHYLLIDSIANNIRLTFSREQTKLNFTVFMADIYNQAFELVYRAYSQDYSEEWIKKALYFSEKRKALILLEQINSKKALQFGQIDPLIQQKEANLQDKIIRIKNEIKTAQETDNQEQYAIASKQLFITENLYDSLLNFIDKNYKKYYNLSHNVKIANLDQIRLSVLDGETAMLHYYTTPKNTYAIYIDEDTSAIYYLNSSAEIKKSLFSYLDKINKIESGYEPIAYQLFTQLWEPIKLVGKFKKVKVIPSGFISYLPFETLLTKWGNESSNKQKPWLIQEYQISYAYSGSFLLNNPIQRHKRAPLALFISPNFSGNENYSLQTLSGATEEAQTLKQLFAGASLEGEKATESQFKALSGNFSVIHLATHTLMDDSDPMSSRLVFSQKGDTLNDGYLYNYELYNIELKADLVTLSACNTGLGTMIEGEGIISLARGFAYAGSPSIVMSLWPAADKVTADLMKGFYENLKFGLDKDEALRLAKIKFLQEQNNLVGHPYYWGSFILMGQTDPIRVKNLYGYYFAFGLILLLGVIWAYRKRKSMNN